MKPFVAIIAAIVALLLCTTAHAGKHRNSGEMVYVPQEVETPAGSPLIEAPAPVDASAVPEHARACVHVNGCSGVVISKGDKWARILLARHCFRGAKLNDKFAMRFIDGSQAEGILLTTDWNHDLALVAVPSKSILGIAPVAVGRPDKARYEAVGWPSRCRNNVCRPELTYYRLKPTTVQSIGGEADQFRNPDGTAPRWVFEVDNGGNTPGASGMPIFANGQVVGINSNNNGHRVGTICYCAGPEQLHHFLNYADTKAGVGAWKLGNWAAHAVNFEDAPAPLAYGAASNSPLHVQAPQIPLAPPPPDAGHEPGEAIPPQPDPRFSQGSSDLGPVYSGHGRKPEDLNSIKKRTHELDLLRHEFAEFKAQVQAGQIKGDPGQDGKDGRDGQDFRLPAEPDVGINPVAVLAGILVGVFVLANVALLMGLFAGALPVGILAFLRGRFQK